MRPWHDVTSHIKKDVKLSVKRDVCSSSWHVGLVVLVGE